MLGIKGETAMLTRRSTLLGATLLPFAATAQAPVTLRISTAAPPSDFLAKACEQLKADLDHAAVGVTASVHPASTLFKQGTEVPALQRGTLEMSTMTTFEVAQQIAEYGFLNRAFLLRDYDHLQRVFEKGFSTKSRDTNYGIGLHWCANAVAALGGRIWAASEGPGRGASLHLIVPLEVREVHS